MSTQFEKAPLQIDRTVWQYAFPDFQKSCFGYIFWDFVGADLRLLVIVCNRG